MADLYEDDEQRAARLERCLGKYLLPGDVVRWSKCSEGREYTVVSHVNNSNYYTLEYEITNIVGRNVTMSAMGDYFDFTFVRTKS